MPDEVLRDSARAGLAGLVDDIATWCPQDVAWCQRYLVVQASRSLYTVRTGEVASKRDALRWAMVHGDPRWRPLLQQVLADRDLGLDPQAAPRPGVDGGRAGLRGVRRCRGLSGSGRLARLRSWMSPRSTCPRPTSTTRSSASSGSSHASTPSSTRRRPTSVRPPSSRCRRRRGRTATPRRSPTRSSSRCWPTSAVRRRPTPRTTSVTCRRSACCRSCATGPVCRGRWWRSASVRTTGDEVVEAFRVVYRA